MAANTSPIYAGKAAFQAANIPSTITANTKSDGTGTIGTDMTKLFTADATNGSYVESVRLCPYASVAATNTAATTIRLFVSTKTSGVCTAADTFLLAEIATAVQAADHSLNATFFIDVPINKRLPPSYTILASQHIVAATSTGWQVLVFGGDYTP
jgi:hypothetical protein